MLSCGTTLLLTVITIMTCAFIMYLVVAKQYKLRDRDRQVNLQAIIKDHYERYLDQEENY